MRDTDDAKMDNVPLSTESGKNGRMNAYEWNDYAHSKSVDRFGLWHNDWASLSSPDAGMPESSISKFYKKLMETVYEKREEHSIASKASSYGMLYNLLCRDRNILFGDSVIYTLEENDIIFELYVHEVVALFKLWEKNNYSESMAIDILKALCYVTATVNTRQEWVHYSGIFPDKNNWERALADVKPNF